MKASTDTDFIKLAMAFPSLQHAPGISPWNPNRLDIWAAEEADEPAAIAAAQFLLSVWNRSCRWQCGSFDVTGAFETWDSAHRLGFLNWATREPKSS